jgi:hypothetical protein
MIKRFMETGKVSDQANKSKLKSKTVKRYTKTQGEILRQLQRSRKGGAQVNLVGRHFKK